MNEALGDYDYQLPEELIASRPLERRDSSRMLVLHRASGRIEHRLFAEFPAFLRDGDLVVMNNSKVVKARVFSEDHKIEFLFLKEVRPRTWMCLVKPGRKMRVGTCCRVAGTTASVLEILPDGSRIISVDAEIDLEKWGQMPVPPYFRREGDSADDERYQTVYAGPSGSIAAPTAGLHFTPGILSEIPHAFITLHVGIGTFQPVKVDRVADHTMHSETYFIPNETAQAVNRSERILAIGTTSARVLESQPPGPLSARGGSTDIFIYPPYTFHHVDALLTNFHLPKSTLLMLVSALAGRDAILLAYAEAIAERYRFFSYGDCMLII